MKQSGQIVLTTFPFTDLSGSKLRPVLMLRQASVRFDDWLVCMVSSRLHQAESGFDEWISPTDADFAASPASKSRDNHLVGHTQALQDLANKDCPVVH